MPKQTTGAYKVLLMELRRSVDEIEEAMAHMDTEHVFATCTEILGTVDTIGCVAETIGRIQAKSKLAAALNREP